MPTWIIATREWIRMPKNGTNRPHRNVSQRSARLEETQTLTDPTARYRNIVRSQRARIIGHTDQRGLLLSET
jgi:hypothetical protein